MRSFGQLKDGTQVHLYVLQNEFLKVGVTDYGASLVELEVIDGKKKPVDVVLGFADVTGYEEDPGSYIGCNVGRIANRISGAFFELNGVCYHTDANEGENTLHSGLKPYSKRMWKVEWCAEDFIVFTLHSPDGDQGFPGAMDLKITYQICGNALHITYEGCSDKDTYCSLTNHSYFNLNGAGNGDIYDHRLCIHGDSFVPTDAHAIPTGEILPVDNTPMDFRQFKAVGSDIDSEYQPINSANGYDHNYCLSDYDGSMREAAVVYSPKTHIRMSVLTDYPGLQLYTANFLEKTTGKCGAEYGFRSALCLEAQYYPDAVNKEGFMKPLLKKGEDYHKEIVFQFDLDN